MGESATEEEGGVDGSLPAVGKEGRRRFLGETAAAVAGANSVGEAMEAGIGMQFCG
jgi:hypothetical protein